MAEQESHWSFDGPTAPFYDGSGGQPARFVLAQVDDDRFRVLEPLLYDDGEVRVRVPRNDTVSTDLASIPFFMAWFVPVNGRHTPAALVHDSLLEELRDQQRDGLVTAAAAARLRSEADSVFMRAMIASEVPLLRRGLMYAAVTLATRWAGTIAARIGAALWVALSLLGSVALVWGIATGEWVTAAVAMLAPLPASLLWGLRRWRPAVLAGYGAWMIALPALGTALGYGAYWVTEQAVRPLAAGRSGDGLAGSPPPAPYR